MSGRAPPEEAWTEQVLQRLFSLKHDDESDAAFARRLGLQPQHLSNYRNGHHGLSLLTAVRIGRSTGVSLDWLLSGRGEPFLDDGRPVEEDSGHDRGDVLDELKGLSRAVERRLDLLEEMGDLTQEEARPLRASLERLLELGDG